MIDEEALVSVLKERPVWAALDDMKQSRFPWILRFGIARESFDASRSRAYRQTEGTQLPAMCLMTWNGS